MDLFPCVQRVPWSFDLRGHKRTHSGRSPVSRRSQHGDGLEECEDSPINRQIMWNGGVWMKCVRNVLKISV
ncbi:MAG: hypothetical protein MUD03_13905, partial [Pirellula sp.]|nr:hypothetical protein [Pirellula sp.]